MLAQKGVIRILIENDIAELSACESHQKATNVLQAICRRISQLSSAINSAEIGNCCNPNWVIRRFVTGSKTMRFVAYLRYSVQSHASNIPWIFYLYLPEIAFKLNLNMKQCFHPSDQQKSHPHADDSSPILTLTSPCISVLPSIY